MNKLLGELFINILKKKTHLILKKRGNIVKNIVNPHHVIKWDFLKKLPVDPTKIVTSNLPFKNFCLLLLSC